MANRIVGYFENWAQYRQSGGKFMPSQINPSLFTHVNFAFGLFGFVTWSVDPTETRAGPERYTGDYTIQPVEWNDQTVLYPGLQALKQQDGALKTLLSIGGWSMNSGDDMPNSGNPHPYGPYTYQLFSKMAADPAGRTQFIGSAIAYAQKYGFDGIDIDWEYPGYISRGGDPNDLTNFLALVQEFRSTAGPGFLLTMAAPAIVPTGLPQTYHDNPSSFFQWLQQCSQSLDWLNIMSYDYHGAFDDPVKIGTGVNSPLVQDSTPNGPFSIKQTVDAYRAAGIAADKMVLGMPTYGRNYTVANPSQLASNAGYGQQFNGAGPAGPATQVPGVLAYYEIKQQLAAGNLTQQWDTATLTPYAYNATSGEWVSYDNEDSLAYKTAYVNAMGLGGAMVWSIDNDDFANGSPLVTKVNGIVNNPQLAPQLPSALMAKNAPPPQSWMSQLRDTLKLSELTIPGTHESCARVPQYINGAYNANYTARAFVDCQDSPLLDQLSRGIRYLDIRCRRTQDVFAIHHEGYYMGFNFGAGVRDVCIDFLMANPSECIVMQVNMSITTITPP
jgi:GH18 family chitinase